MASDDGTADSRPDAHLMARMSLGDRDAFAELFARHHRRVYRFAMQMTGSPDEAEDITQDVFMALAGAPSGYREARGALPTYLYGIARHVVARRVRRRRLRNEVDLGAAEDGSACYVVQDPMADLATTERMAALRRALLALPSRYREVLVLCELHGLSYEEAADVIGRPIGTVRSRLSRGRRLLAERCRALGVDRAPARSASWCFGRRAGVIKGTES